MLRLTDITLPLDHADTAINDAVLARLKLKPGALRSLTVAKRSYDARKRGQIQLIYSVDVDVADEAAVLKRVAAETEPNRVKVTPTPDTTYRFIAKPAPNQPLRPIVVGMGPCGLFAALVLAQMGLKPIVLERGKQVRERTVDTFGLWRKKVLNPESNVQYGEGGAGTFSDGKLYSQISDKRHLGRKVLDEFVKAGAPDEILYVSKPHIGTFRLVSMVEHMRGVIESLGGEIRFSQRVDDLLIDVDADGVRHLRGVVLASGETLRADHVVMALGHSARDTFAMLHARGVHMEAKPFSIGFRIEHPQSVIDQARFGPQSGHPILGAADYKLVHHCKNGRSVYSFCMCPGGTVVAAASEPGRVVTNGMSQYSRNERNANAAIVVGITPEDYAEFDPSGSPLAGIALQRHSEAVAFKLGGETYEAPAQKLGDFLAGTPSQSLGTVVNSHDEAVWDHSVFSKNRDRLNDESVASEFLQEIVRLATAQGLMSDEHFSVDGTLLQAWASQKSFRPKEGPPDGGGPRNAAPDFKGQQRKNDTHASSSDPESRLYRKGNTGAQLSYQGHVLMEHRSGLVRGACVSQATGHGERDAALALVKQLAGERRRTLAADKAYDTADFVAACRDAGVTPHVAQDNGHRRRAIDGRTTRHAGYAMSLKTRAWIEAYFGWIKAAAGMRQLKQRGLKRVEALFQFAMAASNLVRLPKLLAAGATP